MVYTGGSYGVIIMNWKDEFNIMKYILIKPSNAIDLLNKNWSYFRTISLLVFYLVLYPLAYIYGTFVGNPLPLWIAAFPYEALYQLIMLIIMIILIILIANIISKKDEYPLRKLSNILLTITVYPLSIYTLIILIIELIFNSLKLFYVSSTLLEYGFFFSVGWVAVLIASTLSYLKNVLEYKSIILAVVLASIFIIGAQFYFIHLFANLFYK